MVAAVVRTGDEYQAQIPELLSEEERQRIIHTAVAAPAPYRQLWGQPPADREDAEVAQFLTEFSRVSELEQALQCLFDSDFDVPGAVQRLHAARRQKLRDQQEDAERLGDDAFAEALSTHGKKFHLVKQDLPGASTRDAVRRFYLWKPTAAYAQWRERDQARKRKETARLRRWADDSDSDAPSDYHNEFCDLCCTGGQLLCCDGCCRAFHFSCVSPPIQAVPQDDWFCQRCRALLGQATPPTRPSDENPFCRVAALDERSVDVSRLPMTPSGSDDDIEDSDRDVDVSARPSGSLTDQDESDDSRTNRPTAKKPHVTLPPKTAGAVIRSGATFESVPTLRPPLQLEVVGRKRHRKLDTPRRIVPHKK